MIFSRTEVEVTLVVRIKQENLPVELLVALEVDVDLLLLALQSTSRML